MNTEWKIIFQYPLGKGTNAQVLYDQLFKAALTYKFSKTGLFAVPVDNKILTHAIFDLNSHDQLKVGRNLLNGQKVKELFITIIFLKHLETNFATGDNFFIVIPEKETSCDTAVIVSKLGAKLTPKNTKQLQLSSDHYPFEFQVKEYINFDRLKNDQLLTPKNVDTKKLSGMAGQYAESILVFMRDFLHYQSHDIQSFFDDYPNALLIAMPDTIEKDGTKIMLNPDKHNYIITFSEKTFSIASFNRPSFLVSDDQIKKML